MIGHPLGNLADVATSDAELVACVRAGDIARYPELVIRHGPAAVRLAAQVSAESDPDLLVGEAFDRVLEVLHTGGGPRHRLPPYLPTVVRRLHSTEQPAPYGPAAEFSATALRRTSQPDPTYPPPSRRRPAHTARSRWSGTPSPAAEPGCWPRRSAAASWLRRSSRSSCPGSAPARHSPEPRRVPTVCAPMTPRAAPPDTSP